MNILKISETNPCAFHIFSEEILKTVKLDYIINNINSLVDFFKNKYIKNKYNLIGRYKNDRYYNGHIWIICSISLARCFIHLSKIDNCNEYLKKAIDIVIYIISINPNIDLAEQYDIDNDRQLSAKKLTWNYAELYNLFREFQN